jgi:hypothetical protein
MFSLLLVLTVPYATFVFTAENFNPLSKPKNYISRFSWHIGRRIGFVLFIGLATNFILAEYYFWPLKDSILIAALIIISGSLLTILYYFNNRKKF